MDVAVCKYMSMGIFLGKAFFFWVYLLSIFFVFLLHDNVLF